MGLCPIGLWGFARLLLFSLVVVSGLLVLVLLAFLTYLLVFFTYFLTHYLSMLLSLATLLLSDPFLNQTLESLLSFDFVL